MGKLKLVVVAVLFISSTTFAQDKTIVEIAANNPSLSTFVKAIEATGLDAMLETNGPFTVLAPTNNAFNALTKDQLNSLMNPKDKTELTKLLMLHILPTKIMSTDLKNGQMVKTTSGKDIEVKKTDAIMINGASIVKPDIEASNGIVQIVDKISIEKSMKNNQ